MAMSQEEEARLLSEVDVLEALSPGEVDELAGRLPDTEIKEGEFVYTPRERGEELFLLKSGRVRVYKTGPRGGEFTLSVLNAGTVFGEMGLGPRRLRMAYARAVEDSLVAKLRRDGLEELINRNPEVGLKMIGVLSDRLRLSTERMADFAFKDVAGRLASLILYLVEGEGVATGEDYVEGYEIPGRYTHERLGTMIGAQRVAVTRALAGLREAGTVEQRRGRLVVPDVEALERKAGAKR